MLRCLAGLAPIDRGRIAIDDAVLDDPSTETFVAPEQRPVGVVFQDYLLFDHLTVLENVAFGLRARGDAEGRGARDRPRSGSNGSGSTTTPRCGRGRCPGARRNGSRSLVHWPPTPGCCCSTSRSPLSTPAPAATVRRDLRRHLETFDGMRVLVTHDPVDAYALADRVAILDGGRIVQTGTLAEVSAHPRSRYVADLVGVNLVSGTISNGVLTNLAGANVVIAAELAGPALAVIRPNSISVGNEPPAGSSVRNVWYGTIGDIDRLGDRIRVGIVGALPLTAEITPAALDALQLRPGDEIYASVKATDIDVYPA